MEIPAVILDSSVLVAGLRSKRGVAYRLLTMVGTERFETHVTVPLVLEYEDVLARHAEQLHLSSSDVAVLLDYLCLVSGRHAVFYLWRPYLVDPGDDMVLEAAVTAACTHIITFNVRHFVKVEQFGIRAMTPAQFLAEIGDPS